MNSIKHSIQKLLLIVPMLVVMLALTSFTTSQQTFQFETKTAFAHSQTKNTQTLSIVDIAVEDVVFNEAENSELDLEFDFSHRLFSENWLLDFRQEPRFIANKFNFHTTNQVLPLYDLFCNWKLNLLS